MREREDASVRRRSSVSIGNATATSLVLQTFSQAAAKRHHASLSTNPHGGRNSAPLGHDLMQSIINTSPGCYPGDDGSLDVLHRYNFYAHGKRFLFAPCSLGIFEESSRFRQQIIWCITSKWFDYLILALILANSIILALADYSTVDEFGNLASARSFRNAIVNNADEVFTSLFLVECSMKIIAMGLIGGRGAYLTDPWNWLDFGVVFTGVLAVIPGIPNVSILRTFRVLRPLRSLNAVAGMKKLVTALLKSIPELLTVVAFLTFLFFLYGLVGVQLWNGVLHPRCRLTPMPLRLDPSVTLDDFDQYQEMVLANYTSFLCHDEAGNALALEHDSWTHDTSAWKTPRLCFWPIAPEPRPRTCALNSSAYRQCPLGQTCGSDYDNFGNFRFTHPDERIEVYVLRTATYNPEMNWGYTNFDHIGTASLTIFQSITREGWSTVMYMLQDAGYTVVSVVYFVTFIVFGSFFMLNLTLAVIWENFSEASLAEAQERKGFLAKAEKTGSDGKPSFGCREKAFLMAHPPTSRFQNIVGRLIDHWMFVSLRTALILLNTVILSLDQYPPDKDLEAIVEKINFALVVAFLLEAILKIVGLGWRGWARDLFNIFDALVVCLSLVDIVMSPPEFLHLWESTENTSSTNSFSGLRSARLLTLFKLARSWSSLQKLLSTILGTIREVGNFSVLFLLFIYIYALIGMQTFANQFRFDERGFPATSSRSVHIPRANFDSLLWSVVTVFQILTGENWNNVMMDGWRSTGWTAVLYFVSLVVFGNFIILNLFLAILLGNFEESGEQRKEEERDARARKSRVAPSQSMLSVRSDPDGFSTRSFREGQGSTLASARSRRETTKRLFSSESNVSRRNLHEQMLTKPMANRSLCLFKTTHPVRKFALRMIGHPGFDAIPIVLIAISTLALAADNPLHDPESFVTLFLSYLDVVLTSLFIAEVCIKVLAVGFIMDKGAYLRDGWNVMDFAVTTLAAISMNEGSSKYKFIKTLRTFRALRPLRMINRNPGLKLVVNSLIAAIPQIVNVIVVCLLVFTIFSILAVNNFKGRLYSCNGDVFDSLESAQQQLITFPVRWSELTSYQQSWFNATSASVYAQLSDEFLTSRTICQLLGATWSQTIPQSFDNVMLGLQAFFEMTTTEGWVDIMLAGVDATSVNMQPIPNNREGWAFFFVAFVLVGTYFVMQLFIGVVIENFNRMKEKLDGTYALTNTQREWLIINDTMLSLRPLRKVKVPKSRTRRLCFRLARNANFDLGITGCIILNTVIMSMTYFGEEDLYRLCIDYSNDTFAFVFAMEAVIKIVGLGRYYWKDSWNVFDFFVFFGSLMGMFYEMLGGRSVGTVATAFRSVRVGRLFRLLQSAPSLRQLFNTLIMTMPSLVNIGGLLFLVFFIYAAMGVQLFAKVKMGEFVTTTTNFQSISSAMITLVRCATGEQWNDLMYELASDKDCVPDPSFNPDMCGFSAELDCIPLNGCGSSASFLYFFSFTLLVSFILLNIFIAVILEGFANEKDRSDGLLLPHHIENFVNCWAIFDKEATGFIEWHELPRFLEELEPPLGFGKDYKPTSREIWELVTILDLPIFRGNRVFFNDVARRMGKFVVDELSSEPLDALPASLNMDQRWRKYLTARRIKKSDLSPYRVTQFQAAVNLHEAVKALVFQADIKSKVTRFDEARKRYLAEERTSINEEDEEDYETEEFCSEEYHDLDCSREGWI